MVDYPTPAQKTRNSDPLALKIPKRRASTVVIGAESKPLIVRRADRPQAGPAPGESVCRSTYKHVQNPPIRHIDCGRVKGIILKPVGLSNGEKGYITPMVKVEYDSIGGVSGAPVYQKPPTVHVRYGLWASTMASCRTAGSAFSPGWAMRRTVWACPRS